MKNIPEGMTKYGMGRNGKICFCNEASIIGVGFEQHDYNVEIGCYRLDYIKDVLKLIERSNQEVDKVNIFVSTHHKQLAFMKIGEFEIAPRIENEKIKVKITGHKIK